MGVDTRVSLPGNVRVQDVASVIGMLLGLPHETSGHGDTVVRGATVVGHMNIPEMAAIYCRQPNGEVVGGFHFHFESPGGRRLLSSRATSINIAVGRRLIAFFGGSVDYNDCDAERADETSPDKSDDENTPEDGEPWHDLQRRIADVAPLRPVEIKRCQKWAAY